MREGWTYKKLGEVCAHKQSIMRANNHLGSNNLIKYIDISSIDNSKNAIVSTTPYVLCDAPSRAQQIVEKGDILISLVRPNLKNVAIVLSDDNKLVASSGFCVLRPKNIINNRYVFYIVRGEKFTNYLLRRVQGANYPAVREEDVKGYDIPVPPLPEQEHIVSELDLLSSIIEKKKEQLKEYDQLAQSIFYDMFGDPVTNEKGWEVKKLGEVYKLKSGDNLSAKHFVDGQYPVYGGNGISGFHNSFNMDGNYIIIGRVGAYCGNVRNVIGKFWLTDNAFQLIYDIKRQNPIFVKFVLTYLDLHQYANHAAQPVISNISLKEIKVPYPPLSLQQSFASKIEAIERQKELIKQSIAETETLFNSRMDYYFN